MCGIFGEPRFDGAPPDLAAIARMSEKLARRGPDQPMVDPTLQLALVFNGTIYNDREPRTELAALGYAFFSEGDSEVILKADHAWGEDCV